MAYIFTSILGTPSREKKKNWIQVFHNKAIQNEVARARTFVSPLSFNYSWFTLSKRMSEDDICGRGVKDGIVLTGCEWEGCGYFKLLSSQYFMHISTSIHLCKQQIFISLYCTSHCLFVLRSLSQPSPENLASCLSLPTIFQLQWPRGGISKILIWEVRKSQIIFSIPLSVFWASCFCVVPASHWTAPPSSIIGSPSYGIASTSDSRDTIPFLDPLGPYGGRSFLLSLLSGYFIFHSASHLFSFPV